MSKVKTKSRRRFAMEGPTSKSLLTYGGLVLVHDSAEELEFLFAGMKVVELGSMVSERDTMSIKQHPEMASVQWPLKREDFMQ